jgi:hypothetical protein
MEKYKVGRNIILWVSLTDFLIVVLHTFDYRMGFDFLLLGNILSHITALLFFTGISFVLYGMLMKKEYINYKFSWWDIVATALILLLAKDFFTTLAMPHPLFHDTYWI